jgi:UDP:flavonoid glycosyltransferase YjiC (YdhE family)
VPPAGVAEMIDRDSYNAETAVRALKEILSDRKYEANAEPLKRIIESENGTKTACDAIEDILSKEGSGLNFKYK